MAFCMSSDVATSTKAKPRERPVSISRIMDTLLTAEGTVLKRSSNCGSERLKGKFPTYSFGDILGTSLVLKSLTGYQCGVAKTSKVPLKVGSDEAEALGGHLLKLLAYHASGSGHDGLASANPSTIPQFRSCFQQRFLRKLSERAGRTGELRWRYAMSDWTDSFLRCWRSCRGVSAQFPQFLDSVENLCDV